MMCKPGRPLRRTNWRLIRLVAATTLLIPATGLHSLANASAYSDQVIADGAIHYWRFEESLTSEPAKDEISGIPGQNNNPGIYAGNVTLGQPGAGLGSGSAVRLGGENGTHIALGTPQHPGDSMTVEAWVNLDADATASFSPVIARWDGSYELDINATTGDLVNFVVRNDTNAFGNAPSTSAMTRGEWHHLVGIFDSTDGTARVFLDGVEGGTETIGGVLQNAGGDDGAWYLGRTRGPDSGFAWKGLLDEAAIYPRALTAAEIENHIALASVPEPTGLTLLCLGGLGWFAVRRRAGGVPSEAASLTPSWRCVARSLAFGEEVAGG